ncbi:IclR family transcriptional regulator [Nocardiopsis xinjiangensis]|uniref:IclR family transcriptional regulator n=1 Tax=Nocardiopsis xinjiangensis TaxID=124285 RepID=UPI000527C658|nr:IclR family transcriptional regulator [Nocardiopsis xinjiangensis]
MEGEKAHTRGTSVIVNVMDVLRCFTAGEPLQSVTGIATQVGLHKSSVSRILSTLEQEHVVERDPTSRKYRLGLGLIAIAGPLLANLDVRHVALEAMRTVAENSGETVALSVWDGHEAVTVEQIPSSRPVKHTSALGSRYSTGGSATVQVFLAAHAERADELLGSGRIELPSGESSESYRRRLWKVGELGYGVNYGETSPDEVGVAAPVCDHRGEVVAALLVAAPFFRVSEEEVGTIAGLCRAGAGEIGRRLGSHSPAAPIR